MRLPKDILTGTMTRPRLFLCETDKTKICMLEPIEMSGSFKFNAYSELTFTIGRTYTDMITGETQVNPFYNKIEALRLVYLEGFGYFEIQEPEISSDGIREVKNVTAYSLEYTLSQKYLEEFYINTGENDSVEVTYAKDHNLATIEPVTLYKTDINRKGLSLLNLILDKIPDWSINYVDPALYAELEGRTFEISRASVYDFITQDICEKFNCFTEFDSIKNEINFYAETLITKHIGDGTTKGFRVYPAYWEIGTVTVDGYKTTQYTYKADKKTNTGYLEFYDAPEDGAKIEITDGAQEKWTTDVYVSFENLAQEVTITHSADDIKTVLTVKGADDLDIREVNMGLPYIVDLSYYHSVDWMGQELYNRYTSYLKDNNAKMDAYAANKREILKLENKKDFEESRTSLGYGIDHSVNSDTVGTYYVISGGTYPDYYYDEVTLPSDYNANTVYYKFNFPNVTKDKVYKLYDAVRKYFMDVHHETAPEIKDAATHEGSWQDLLKDLTESKSFEFVSTEFDALKATLIPTATAQTVTQAFRTFLMLLWGEMGLIQLQNEFLTYYEVIEAATKEYADQNSGHYWFYYPITIVLESLRGSDNFKGAIAERQERVDELKADIDRLTSINDTMARNMSVYSYFTKDQLSRLSAFLREDEYTDDNFVTTDIDTIDTLMDIKQELLECGRIELSKLCAPKLAFTMNMANIYALPEFEPIINQFKLGNLINVELRKDYIKRARLLEVNINFDDFSDFSCEFGELTNLRTPSSVHADLLASAMSAGKSVSSNLSYWNKAVDTSTNLSLLIQQGLLDANTVIKSTEGTQGVEIDCNGIHLRKYDKTTGALDPEEGWIVNNQILYSSDNFKNTTEAVFGKYTITDGNGDKHEMWGLLAKAVMSGYLAGCTMEGGTINIGEGTFVVDSAGNVTMNAASIAGYVTNNKLNTVKNDLSNDIDTVESNLSSRITVTEKGIETKVSKDSIISTINQSAEKVTIDADKISLAGKKINLTSDNITIASTNFSVTKDGKITANSGTIGSWNIGDMENYTESIYSTYCAASTPSSTNPEYAVFLRGKGAETTLAIGVKTRKSSSTSWDDADTPFYVRKDGYMHASHGKIAGWTIYDNLLRKAVTIGSTDYQMYMQAADGADNGTNAFAVRSKASSASDWDVQFAVNYAGKMTAKNAHVTGTIVAQDGTIAGYNIGPGGSYDDAIYKRVSADDAAYEVGIKATPGDTDLAFYVKKSTDKWASSENTFYIRNNGKLYAQDADITGKITASSGKIGGWSITSTRLYSHSASTEDTSRYRMVLGSYGYDDTNRNAILVQSRSSTDDSWTSNFRVRYDGSVYMRNATITGDSTIAAACIPNLNADKITAGTLDVGRIPNISASKITSGTISTARLDASVITTSNFSSKSLSTSNLTVASGCRFGVASEYNARLYTSGSYTNVEAYGPDVNYGISWYALIKQAVQQSASSREIKTEIHDFDEKYDVFFDNLNPQLYKYNFDTVGGYSMGYIWEETKDAYINAGLTSNDVGAVSETEAVPGGKELDRTDFIALNTWQIQKLKARIEELEKKLEGNDTK